MIGGLANVRKTTARDVLDLLCVDYVRFINQLSLQALNFSSYNKAPQIDAFSIRKSLDPSGLSVEI
jgi:hypothetical protein